MRDQRHFFVSIYRTGDTMKSRGGDGLGHVSSTFLRSKVYVDELIIFFFLDKQTLERCHCWENEKV